MIRVIRLLLLSLCVSMAGCAGTIQRESMHGMKRIEGVTYKSVDVVMTDKAKSLQADNPQFSAKELGENVQRRLEAANLMRADSRHRVEVTVESFNVRSMVAAVVFGFLAGTDSIDGYVRVFDDRGMQLHAYKVNASYSLGGLAGSLDSMRMGWMYDKFGELTIAELTGKTEASSVTPGDATGQSATPAAPAGSATPPKP